MKVDYSMFEASRPRQTRAMCIRAASYGERRKVYRQAGRGKYLRREARGGAWK